MRSCGCFPPNSRSSRIMGTRLSVRVYRYARLPARVRTDVRRLLPLSTSDYPFVGIAFAAKGLFLSSVFLFVWLIVVWSSLYRYSELPWEPGDPESWSRLLRLQVSGIPSHHRSVTGNTIDINRRARKGWRVARQHSSPSMNAPARQSRLAGGNDRFSATWHTTCVKSQILFLSPFFYFF
jgi:hypothetical protein